MGLALTVLLIAVSGHMQELPAGEERPQVASVQPVADPVPDVSVAPVTGPVPEARVAPAPTPPRTARPVPAPAPTPAPSPEAAATAPMSPGGQGTIVGVVRTSRRRDPGARRSRPRARPRTDHDQSG
jgi:hypothetical protein